MASFRQYAVLVGAGFRIELQYPANFAFTAFGAVAGMGASLGFVGVIVHQFGALGGWGVAEVALIFGLRTASHGLANALVGKLRTADEVIRSGDFDRYLVRPVHPFIQLVARRFPLPSVGDIGIGIGVLAVAAAYAPVDWDVPSIGYLLAAVAGGTLVEAAILTSITALEFRLLSTFMFKEFVDGILTTFGPYPLHVLNRAASYALTFVLPLAFIAYFPVTTLLGRTDELTVPVALAAAAPLVGAVAFAGSFWFFVRQLRHYQSPGH